MRKPAILILLLMALTACRKDDDPNSGPTVAANNGGTGPAAAEYPFIKLYRQTAFSAHVYDLEHHNYPVCFNCDTADIEDCSPGTTLDPLFSPTWKDNGTGTRFMKTNSVTYASATKAQIMDAWMLGIPLDTIGIIALNDRILVKTGQHGMYCILQVTRVENDGTNSDEDYVQFDAKVFP